MVAVLAMVLLSVARPGVRSVWIAMMTGAAFFSGQMTAMSFPPPNPSELVPVLLKRSAFGGGSDVPHLS